MEQLARFDDFFFTICKETGGIEGLLHSFFSFLFRRTDFYYESDPGDKMGFPPGVNQKMLLSIFLKYQSEHYKRFPKKELADYEEKLKKIKEQKSKEQQQQQSNQQKAEVQQSKKQVDVQSQEQQQQQQQSAQQMEEGKQQQQQQSLKANDQDQKQNVQNQQNTQQQTQSDQQQQNKKTDSSVTYNGGVTKLYSWSQSIHDVTVQINLPPNTTKRNLLVDLRVNSLKVQVKGEEQPRVNGELYYPIKIDDSLWSIEDGNKLILTLEKAGENIWKTVIKGDDEIDATKVDNSKPLEEFDDETQGALRKIMYEQQRKQMGLPTTDEEKQMDMLKKAWNADNSPFKGQPFDPTKFNMPQGQFNMQ